MILFIKKTFYFTLLELLLVLVIIMLLMAIIIPILVKVKKNAQNSVAINDVRTVIRKIDEYTFDNNKLPEYFSDFISPTPVDPWQQDYVFNNFDIIPAGHKRKKHANFLNTTYDLFSKGPDRKSTSPLTSDISMDDILRADDGSYVGLAKEY